MLRFLVLTWLALVPLAQAAQASDCGGNDLLAAMPAPERAALDARAAAYPYPRGLLWQATRGDTRLTLFGTYHLAHDMTQTHLDALLPRAMAADISYFELTAADTDRLERATASDPSVMFITTGPSLPDLLTEDEWRDLQTKMSARGFPAFLVAKFKPIFVSMMLGLSPCEMRASKGQNRGIDQRLAETLDTAGHDTRSIEDYLTTLTVLDRFSRREQIDLLRLSLSLPVNPDDIMETMFRTYVAGETALLWEFGKDLSLRYGGATAAQDFARFEEVLLTRRNRAWAELLDQTPAGQSLFIAVGAGHLPGDQGVLNLLAQRGFAITALPFD